MRTLLLASVVVGLCRVAAAGELPRALPAELGLEGAQLERIGTMLKQDVADHVLPGAVLVVARHGKVAYEQAFGNRDPQAGDAPMRTDDIFRIYSMSKPITVVAALSLVEAGKLQMDDPVAKYLPAFKAM